MANIYSKQMLRKTITKDKEGHFITIKGSTHQKDTTSLNTYAPDTRASHMKRRTAKGESIRRSGQIHSCKLQHPAHNSHYNKGQKISKSRGDVNNTIIQPDDNDIYTTL